MSKSKEQRLKEIVAELKEENENLTDIKALQEAKEIYIEEEKEKNRPMVPLENVQKLIDEAITKKFDELKSNVTDETLLEKIDNASKKQIDAFTEALKSVKSTDPDAKLMNSDSISIEDINPDDILDEPVVFYCYLSGMLDFGYTHFGIKISPPYNRPIKFVSAMSFDMGEGRFKESVHVSTATIFSQKELDYMEKHRDNGILFFREIKKSMEINKETSKALQEAAAEINSMRPNAVLEHAKSLGFDIKKEDHNKIVRELILKRAEDKLVNNHSKTVTRKTLSSTLEMRDFALKHKA